MPTDLVPVELYTKAARIVPLHVVDERVDSMARAGHNPVKRHCGTALAQVK